MLLIFRIRIWENQFLWWRPCKLDLRRCVTSRLLPLPMPTQQARELSSSKWDMWEWRQTHNLYRVTWNTTLVLLFAEKHVAHKHWCLKWYPELLSCSGLLFSYRYSIISVIYCPTSRIRSLVGRIMTFWIERDPVAEGLALTEWINRLMDWPVPWL